MPAEFLLCPSNLADDYSIFGRTWGWLGIPIPLKSQEKDRKKGPKKFFEPAPYYLFDLPAPGHIYYLNKGWEKWDKTLQEACKDPASLEQAAKIYKIIAYLGPKEFWEFMQDEYKRYLPLAVKMRMRK